MRLLLHICCGPCSAFPLTYLREHSVEVTGFFYNPNIHPYKEFRKRLETAREFARRSALELIVDDRYTLEEFLSNALTAGKGRCSMCYELRLRRTAQYAKEYGFDCFSTTLLVSPYQQHDQIKNVCVKVAREEGISFSYYDFRPGWQQGVQISKDMELYRQPYCGCIFSEKERYMKKRSVNR
ncbi:hypothetical protein P22_0165 [Propionispora sp. 2/2-37]|uniref:epoxyqueuosine reductase QueH n=1 Tax=Propionispora sp. 2/2-37 TaxID=1677858 RepID=UPI0006BB5AB4|nr:epoxyqueuosine reductase QueH [Propionispora sp. 2/2-37]CUH94103.1 hypothetical protein P22_0165 [Propionispora sp. 2/2-37]